MVRLASVFFLALGGLAAAAPIRLNRRLSFPLQAYADFQISDGTAGTAQAQANAVFVDPFNGVDLTTVSDDIIETMNTMREAAESAETDDFDPQIDAASGATATALQNGKIKNKVLKLTGEVQVLNIKIAQAKASGDSTSDLESDLADEQGKLTTNIATDVKNAGAPSQGVTGGTTNDDATSASSAVSSAAASSTAASSAAASSAAASSTSTAAASSASTAAQGTADGSSFQFAVQDYADFQISDGTAGNALAEANAVFVDPFASFDLSTISDDVVENLNTMREAAEDAETDDFDPQIDAASGATATALQNGKIKNKVLKLVGEVQGINIKIAKAKATGASTSDLESDLATEQAKLTTNIATDQKNAGAPSQGVA